MNALEIKNLSKTFGSFKALSELNLEVEENKVFGFLGPNGAGKSTTIRMIVGLSKPTSGEIKIFGETVQFNDVSTHKLIGYLPEHPSFYGWMSGEEYLNFVCDLFNVNDEDKKKKTERLLDRVNLNDAKKRKIRTYSNGMKQRLGIAQSLVGDPKLLVMDEPVSALDPIGRREVLEVIQELKKETTIFMSTHILSDVDRICDDIAILNHGQVVLESPLSKLKSEYAHPILEVEFMNDPEEIFQKLQEEEWVKRVEKNGNMLKIWLNDLSIMERNLPLKELTEFNTGILKYGLNFPQLEDIFVDILEAKK